jgi:hypothetical protein
LLRGMSPRAGRPRTPARMPPPWAERSDHRVNRRAGCPSTQRGGRESARDGRRAPLRRLGRRSGRRGCCPGSSGAGRPLTWPGVAPGRDGRLGAGAASVRDAPASGCDGPPPPRLAGAVAPGGKDLVWVSKSIVVRPYRMCLIRTAAITQTAINPTAGPAQNQVGSCWTDSNASMLSPLGVKTCGKATREVLACEYQDGSRD